MPNAPEKTACFAVGDACRRCQVTKNSHSEGAPFLLLGPRNGNVKASLVKALVAAKMSLQTAAGVLALPVPQDRLRGPILEFLERLPQVTMQDVQGAFFSGDLNSSESALDAFIQGRPLTAILHRAQHDWVRDALSENWLFSHFHPIVHAGTSEVFAYEALIRARHPETGKIIGAGPIIEAAVTLELEHVLDQRARQAAMRNAAALQMPGMKLFINFMPNTIYDPEVCLRTTMETAEECGMDFSQLVFEVVETEHIPDMKRLKTILDYYRSRGVGTAVDDMGAGFSSLQYFRVCIKSNALEEGGGTPPLRPLGRLALRLPLSPTM